MTATVRPAPAREPFEFKSASLNLISFAPKCADLTQLEEALAHKFNGHEDFFSGEPAVLDLAEWPDSATALELAGLLQLLRKHGLQPIAVRGGGATARDAARDSGLPTLHEARSAVLQEPKPTAAPEPAPTPEPPPPSHPNTVIIDKPVRSGQQIYARGGDLIVLALVSHGAELIADGNIHVYAPLRGRALAGARGNEQARIFSNCMEAELLSIAGVYRAMDEPLPQSILGKPGQVRLEGNKLMIEALE